MVKRIIQYFCFPNRPVEGVDLEKGGGGMTPLTNYDFGREPCKSAPQITQ